jgi:TnpA family transposase
MFGSKYPSQNSLAFALREISKVERTLFKLAWLEDPALRRRVTVGLNKGRSLGYDPAMTSCVIWSAI